MSEKQEAVKAKVEKTAEEPYTEEMQKMKELLHSKYTNLRKMSMKDLKEEVQMWRNIWDWIPSDVKYYVSRTGQQVGVQIRNYKRFIGPLLETYWKLEEVEVGCYDKVFDQTTGTFWYERKIVKFPVSQIVAWDWIAERIEESKLLEQAAHEEEIQQLAEETPTTENNIEKI